MKTISCALCRAALPLLLEAETDVSASPARGEAAPATVAEHLASCVDCSRELALLRAVRDSSRSLGEAPAPAALRMNVRAALQAEANAAADRQARGENAWTRWLAPRRRWQPAFTWSSGVALAAFALFATTRSQQPMTMTVPQDETRTEAPAADANQEIQKKTAPQANGKAGPAPPAAAARPAPATSAAPATGSAAADSSAASPLVAPPLPAAPAPREEPAPVFGDARVGRPEGAVLAPPRKTILGRTEGRDAAVPALPASPAKQAPPASIAGSLEAAPLRKSGGDASSGRHEALTMRARTSPAAVMAAGGGAHAGKDETAAAMKPVEARPVPRLRSAPPAMAPMMAESAPSTLAAAPPAPEMGVTATAPMLADAGAAGPPGVMTSKAIGGPHNVAAETEVSPPKAPFVRLALLPRTSREDDVSIFDRSAAGGAGSSQMAVPGANPVPLAGRLFEKNGAPGNAGPRGPEAAARIDEPTVRQGAAGPADAATTTREKRRTETKDGAASGGLRPPSGVFGMRASGTQGQVGERGSSWPAWRAPARAKTGSKNADEDRSDNGKRDDGKRTAERVAESPAAASATFSAAGSMTLNNGLPSEPRPNSKATLYGTLPALNSNGTTPPGAQPLLTSEVRHAVLLLTPPRAAQNVRVCVTVDGLEFPQAREGVLWRGDVAKDTDLVLPLAVRAARAGTVRARVTLETADGTILAEGMVELFAAP